jgi:flagellar biosynthetic protein FlhB
MAEDMGEKTEAPTGRKLGEARDRGQVVKSTDLAAAIDLAAVAIILVLLGGFVFRVFAEILRRSLSEAPGLDFARVDLALVNTRDAVLGMTIASVPFMILFAIVSAVAYIAQFGMLFTLQPLQPDLSKLDPIKGLGRIFGKRGLMKTIISLFKLAAVSLVSVLVLGPKLSSVVGLPNLELMPGFNQLREMIISLAIWLLVVMFILGFADYFYQRYQHTSDLKMTKKEVTDERKSMDGDPQIKARRLRMMRQILMQQIGANVPKADVIVTNPTHYSVAIQYDQESMVAPRVVAKGVDLMAMRIRQVAMTHRVPIVERPPLARALYAAIEVGQEIPPEHYQAVAEVLAYVYRLEGRAA